MEPGGGLAAPVAESMELTASPSEARDPEPWLRKAMALMVDPDQGSPASRQRRARQALDQARSLGALPPTLDALAQVAALQCLGQALAASGLQQAAICTREVAATTGCPSPSDNPLVDLQVLDRWVHPRSIRRYQEWILRGQGFQLQLDDGTYELVGCRADLDRNRLLLRRCQDGLVQVLLSSECGEGYALTGQLLQAPGSHDGLSAPLGPAIVRAGNENFAHFLWNELDPILEMLGSGSPLEVVQDTDTVLALAALPGGALSGFKGAEPENERSPGGHPGDGTGAPHGAFGPPGRAPRAPAGGAGQAPDFAWRAGAVPSGIGQ